MSGRPRWTLWPRQHAQLVGQRHGQLESARMHRMRSPEIVLQQIFIPDQQDRIVHAASDLSGDSAIE